MERITNAELFDIFKHWDNIEAQKELLYTPLAFGAIAAAATTWDKVSPLFIVAISIGSIYLYIFYLLSVHRFSYIQNAIFKKITSQGLIGDFREIVEMPRRVPGVRALRVLKLPVLMLIWNMLLWAKCSETKLTSQAISCYFIFGALQTLLTTMITFYLMTRLIREKSTS
jgi:hypothetical protein